MTFREIVMIFSVLSAIPFALGFATLSQDRMKFRHYLGFVAYFAMTLWFLWIVSAMVFFGIFGSLFFDSAASWAGNLLGDPLLSVQTHYMSNVHWYFFLGTVFLYLFFWKELNLFKEESNSPQML